MVVSNMSMLCVAIFAVTLSIVFLRSPGWSLLFTEADLLTGCRRCCALSSSIGI